VTSEPDNVVPRVAYLRRWLRRLLPAAGVLFFLMLVALVANPWAALVVGSLNVAVTVAIVLIDRAIVASGGESSWKDGRLR
jgi:hypothetical protein